MNIVIRPVHFETTSQLEEFINKKLSKLEPLFDKIIEAEVFLKLGTKQNIKDKIVEIKLAVPGKTLFASETSKSFEESTDKAVEIMIRQLRKHKTKMQFA